VYSHALALRRDAFGHYEFLTRAGSDHDTQVSFALETSEHWKFAFRSGASGCVVIRGLQFFDDEGRELFPARIVPLTVPAAGSKEKSGGLMRAGRRGIDEGRAAGIEKPRRTAPHDSKSLSCRHFGRPEPGDSG
jgi:hypothetical protein